MRNNDTSDEQQVGHCYMAEWTDHVFYTSSSTRRRAFSSHHKQAWYDWGYNIETANRQNYQCP